MITSYYTLRALAREWNESLPGCIVGDVYSQTRDELTLAFASPGTTWMVRANVRKPFQYLFRSEGYNKARRNVATLFPEAFDKKIAGVRIADRDRMVYIDLDDGSYLQFMLFGPHANVYWVNELGVIVDAFQKREEVIGTPAPQPRPAPVIDTVSDLVAGWRTDRKTTIKAVSKAFPLFGADLAREAVFRAQLSAEKPDACTEEDFQHLFETSQALHTELTTPKPRVYWDENRVVAFSLVSLQAYAEYREEPFDTLDQAVSVYVRRRLGQTRFDAAYLPLEKALRTARDQDRRRLDAMLTSLSEESRADKYERWGHLLMAAQHDIPPGVDSIELDDLFQDNHRVTVPLDPTLTGIENAERYYEKARNTRLARTHAEERLEQIEQRAEVADQLLDELRQHRSSADVKKFAKAEARRLAPFLGQQNTSTAEQIPFRRFDLGSGYEVWVGKNAKQNDDLTFRHARKFDYWLHARGVPGSHTVLRRPGRTAQPQKTILERAASIAAFYSKARGSGLVPVIIVERKHVRKPRGAAPGSVLVDREEVLLVEPGLPG